MREIDSGLPTLERVDAAADRFEAEWRAGCAPRVEDYLAAAPPDDRPALLAALLEVELELRFPGREPAAVARPTGDTVVSRPAGPPAPGDRVEVPGYELLGELGRGAMGIVYEARQLGLRRTVALKMILAGEYADPEAVARFLAEAGLAARLQHPNIVPVYEVGSARGRPFFSLEYVSGGSLADRLRGEPQPPADAARVVEALARAVQFAHDRGVVHRDLKPANVLLAPDGTAKITDFGLARSTDDGLTATGAVLGTPCYMAPEQAEGRKGVGPAADVYALGAILYECLTGRPPFRGATAVETMDQVRSREPVSVRALRPGVPRDLETIALACLRKDPARRYPSAAALADDLGRWMRHEPIVARPVGPAERAWKWVRRNRAASAAVAAGGHGSLATAAAAVVAFEQTKQSAAARDLTNRAIRQGGPADVVAVIRRAEEGGFEVTPELRFEEASALAALGRSDEAQDRLTALLAVELPADLRARAELRLGEELTGTDDGRAARLIEAALKSHRLPPADRAFATATRAPALADAIAELRQALGHNPVHFPAKRLLTLLLVSSGRLAEATRAAEEMRLLYPDSPEPLWVLVFARGLAGDGDGAARALDLLTPHLPGDLHTPVARVARVLPTVRDEFQKAAGRMAGVRRAAARPAEPVVFPSAARRPGANPLLAEPGLPFRRLPPQFRTAADDLWFVVTTNGRTDASDELVADDARRERFAAELDRRPEGFRLFVYGLALMDRAMDYLDAHGTSPPHGDRVRALIAEAGAAHVKAAETPGLLDVRAYALEGAIMAYTVAGRPGWAADPDPKMLQKVADLLRARLKEPEPIPLVNIDYMARAAKHADLTSARVILDEWLRRSPDDPTALRHRAEVELKSEAYRPALVAAEKLLAREPDNAAARSVRNQARAKLGLPPVP
jgi:tetratricopeptide (TPR) repeat protein